MVNLNIIKNIFYDLLKSFFIASIIFAIYVELSPSMGNIWLRLDSNGIKKISLDGLINLMIGPFYYPFYWNYNYFDINFIIYWIVIFCAFLFKL